MARDKARERGEKVAKDADLAANRGYLAGFNAVTEISADPHRMVVNPRPVFPPIDPQMEFRLEEISLGEIERCPGIGPVKGFKLVQVGEGGKTDGVAGGQGRAAEPRLPDRLPHRRRPDLLRSRRHDGLCSADLGHPPWLRRTRPSLDRGYRPHVSDGDGNASDIGASPPGGCGAMSARKRLRQALPTLHLALAGAVAWGIVTGASALSSLVLGQWETPAHVRTVVALFALGGALAFPFGWTLARLLSRGRGAEAAFAAAFVSLGSMTVGLTALLYAFQYRSYYAEWHAHPFTVTWVLQLVFTGLAALYQFATLGMRLYFPLGFAALFAAALWFARRSR